MRAKFRLGLLLVTRGVVEAIPVGGEVFDGLARHVSGDWGEVCPEDQALNDRALVDGDRLLSAYTTEGGTKFWITTEADRSATTVLLPDEY